MKARVSAVLAGACVLAAGIGSNSAQAQEIKEKPPLYTYVSSWVIPRAQWGELEKAGASSAKVLEKALSGGSLVGFGADVAVLHTADGNTHDSWWSSMSMAGLLDTLEELAKAGVSPVLNTATKHWDNVWVSRYYSWKPGSYKGAYTHSAAFKLKADAPDDALDYLSKGFMVPLLEKLMADGTLVEYEIDEQAIHTTAPGTFSIIWISPNSAGEDKVDAALIAAMKTNPFAGAALGAAIDFEAHRDDLSMTRAVYK